MSYASEQDALNAQWTAAQMACSVEEQRLRPFYLLRPHVLPDGNGWLAVYGENIQQGVVGCGTTPEKAADDFDRAWKENRLPGGLKP